MFERVFRGRRPSAPMVISVVALFFAVGGVGYAAVTLPPNSVGTRQLKNNAVNFNKIAPGTIGSARINQTLVQTRVKGTCSGTSGAIGAVHQNGSVSCNPSASKELGTTGTPTAVGTTSATVASRPLGGGTYLLIGAAYASASGTPTVTCSLAVPGGSSQTRTFAVANGRGTLPINLASSVPSAGATATLSCTSTAAATVSGQINAVQTASNS